MRLLWLEVRLLSAFSSSPCRFTLACVILGLSNRSSHHRILFPVALLWIPNTLGRFQKTISDLNHFIPVYNAWILVQQNEICTPLSGGKSDEMATFWFLFMKKEHEDRITKFRLSDRISPSTFDHSAAVSLSSLLWLYYLCFHLSFNLRIG